MSSSFTEKGYVRWLLFCKTRRKHRLFAVLLITGALFTLVFQFYSQNNNQENNWSNEISYVKDRSVEMEKRGVRLIVGHYIGGSLGANLTPEIINKNSYSPVLGAGEGGRPVQLASREIVRARELFSLHGFNILVSDRVPLNRTLPDMRSESCRAQNFPESKLPTASVIIVFHNEAWSTLMRTVTSVLLRSPTSVLKEIILVDDASEREYLGLELEIAIAKLGIVRVLRMKTRTGLVAARLLGSRNATGEVLVFLDAHCEVTTGWLPPLLSRAAEADVFVCPHIDLLSDDTLAYVRSTDAHWGAFSRRLHFRWLVPSTNVLKERMLNPARPYATPAMAGGLFAVRKDLFWSLGGYDEGMKVWGGENIELSWRAWQCGARVEIAPCSRVGHIFRKQSPYSFPGGTAVVLNANTARAALVWTDEWADFFLKFNPSVGAKAKEQDVTERKKIRDKLRCKSFKWYLDTIWPDHFFPSDNRWFGRVKNSVGACAGPGASSGAFGLGGPAIGVICGTDLELEGLLVFTKNGVLMADEGLCLEAGSGSRAVWRGCSGSTRQTWKQIGSLLKTADGRCLAIGLKTGLGEFDGVGAPMLLEHCTEAATQTWRFERVPWR